MIKFYQYPKCTTCKKAARFLDEHGVSYESIDIVQHTPTKQEFKELVVKSEVEINKFFNTLGVKYRELGLKDKLKELSNDEKLELLASDGMLVKRPLAVSCEKVTLGFNEEQYKDVWL
ncbi:arsenate reductase family protein [Staphylococcus hominis]|uniref:arsenate reductase family protein n=1 Tax=Staphylococcus hominis TaxID=1290 RepID=UPI0032048C9F